MILGQIKQEQYYVDAITTIKDYTPFHELVGHPLEILKINRGASSNTRITDSSVTLDIPIKGPRDSGLVHVTATKINHRLVK